MSEEEKPPEPTKTGPCFFGEDHFFQTIYARDPFTGETFDRAVCIKCGAGA